MKNNFLKYFLSITTIIFLATLAVFAFKYVNEYEENSKSALSGGEYLAVVNLNKLISIHPDYSKLNELSEKISILKGQLENPQGTLKSVGLEMKSLHGHTEKLLMEELKKIELQLSEEKNKLKENMTAEQKEIAAEIKNIKETPELKLTAPQKINSKTIKQNLNEFSKDLFLLKEKQVAAKRLEEQNKLSEELRALKEKNENELAAYEREILGQNQGLKINLRLKYENAAGASERDQIMQKMKDLEEKETHLREVKKMQLDKTFEEIKDKCLREIDVKLAAYDYKLQKDVFAQLKGKNIFEASSSKELSSPRAQVIKQKIAAQNEKYKKQLEEINKKYEKQFDQKRKELENKLKMQEKELIAKALKKENTLNKFNAQHIDEIKKQIKDLEEQKDRLYEEILNDIRAKAKDAAKFHKVKYVIGGYLYNADCTDLTEDL